MAARGLSAFAAVLLVGTAGSAWAETGENAAPAPAASAAPSPGSAAAAPAAGATEAKPPRIPSSIFAQQSFVTRPKLSPDGTRLAARMNVGGKEAIGITSLTEGGQPFLVNVPDNYDLNWYRWAGNGTLLISLGTTVPWFDDEAWSTRLLAFDIATHTAKFIGGRDEGLTGDDVLWIDPEGKSLLLSFQKTIYDYPSVSMIDIATNRATQVVRQRADIWDWYADDQGTVRFGFGYDGAKRWQMVYRSTAEDKFSVLKGEYDDEDAAFDAVRIIHGSDEGYAIVRNDATGRDALYKYDFAKHTKGELVYESATNDIEGYDTSEDGKTLTYAMYTDDRTRIHWFDPAMKAVQESLDKAVGQRQAYFQSLSRNGNITIVHVGASNDPGNYYVYQLTEGVMHRFASVNDKLPARQLSPSRYVSYKARDGLDIPAYLTLPRGREAKGLPLIVLPHGGPYGLRDEGDFDPEVQFYANRGYVVLQPQFRGSGSYGEAFYQKGEGQWGRSMQDDLDDGMDWLAKQGTIDPKRVCLVGGSYGGYAALWGAVRNPERYRCAASFAGISDLGRQLKYQLDLMVSRKYRKDWRVRVQGKEPFDLKTVSPLYTIDKLTVPVLLMHGDKDQRVPYRQSKAYADALRAAGKTFEFYTLKDEGHGFSTSAHMQEWFDRMDAFLAKYNPAD